MGGTGYGGVNTNRRLCSITVNYNIELDYVKLLCDSFIKGYTSGKGK